MPKTYPVVVAFDRYRRTQPELFAGSASGRDLIQRIEGAFRAGWRAAADEMQRRLETPPDARLC